ncbi:hypothetical protein CK203_055945 [Vitis vinifera]|uniref:R13L1/DRL21-like LRR repeat region domain-containing protein n=1 Tax=Vitis vinifera TaxID=29760 RepID=A0A438GPQ3_VITVI|nr:hypothetical protein CK203_055945 [Vitis vinifera]
MYSLEANLKSKERLDELVFNWDGNYDAIVGDSLNQPTVLEKLQPHKNLKKLSIEYCGGALPSLKNLWIEKIDGVQRVGPEFDGNGPSSFKPFGSLESLNISRDVELGGMGSF